MAVTFVTTFLNTNNEAYSSIENRLALLEELFSTNVAIVIYVSYEYIHLIEPLCYRYPTAKIAKVVDMNTLRTVHVFNTYIQELPGSRNEKKDTREYLYSINSKCEIVKDAIQENLWNSTHFAYIDATIFELFSKKELCKRYIAEIVANVFDTESFLAFPGCEALLEADTYISTHIQWRFCGNLFIGDAASVNHFCALSEKHYSEYLQLGSGLIWELNYWAWLEQTKKENWIWYPAQHNDTILRLPAALYAMHLYKLPSYYHCLMTMPEIEKDFVSSSACYLYHDGKHILNTRFINYRLMERGNYLIYHPELYICTKNMVTCLDSVNETKIETYTVMDETTVDLPIVDPSCEIFGLEDIRLYSNEQGQLRFIATNRNYSGKVDVNRMVIGNYHYETGTFSECRVIEPPSNTYCEKNWIPVRHSNGEDCFIYQWHPFVVGKIVADSQLEFFKINKDTFTIPDFHRIRGSTVFVDNSPTTMIGLLHFSEEGTPRRYFHMLVTLEKSTLALLKYSRSFCFQHVGIEFCTGFCLSETDQYVFWISNHDKDTTMIRIDRNCLPLQYSF